MFASMDTAMITFSATIVKGLGVAKKQGFPTLNFRLEDVPKSLEQGVFAVHLEITTTTRESCPGVMYYGPRFHHGNELVCEVHCLEELEVGAQAAVAVLVKKKLRDPQKFESDEALVRQIERDAEEAKKILLS